MRHAMHSPKQHGGQFVLIVLVNYLQDLVVDRSRLQGRRRSQANTTFSTALSMMRIGMAQLRGHKAQLHKLAAAAPPCKSTVLHDCGRSRHSSRCRWSSEHVTYASHGAGSDAASREPFSLEMTVRDYELDQYSARASARRMIQSCMH